MSFDENWFPSDEETELGGIYFFSEGLDFKLVDEEQITSWLTTIIQHEKKTLHSLNIIFCTDQYLHQINVNYLNHDTLTDIITFPYADPPIIKGELFISLERIKENSNVFKAHFEQELYRVIAHGVLHLCGYGDKTDLEKQQMRSKENEALHLLQSL